MVKLFTSKSKIIYKRATKFKNSEKTQSEMNQAQRDRFISD